MVEKYIEENGKLPSKHSKDESIKQLGNWVSYSKKRYVENSMKDNIKTLWEEFMKTHKKYSKKQKRFTSI